MLFLHIQIRQKGAIDVQDDYNRFIRRSMKQAQCNYEDIFAADDLTIANFEGVLADDTVTVKKKGNGV